ncbi:hypothetical protein Rhal01_02060 [Rubritalea halochordaticola]|uniref:MFS transporter n=1 Tax=Rubritalea halochordaticola TaxID=714537 RepID=A0ABP9V1U7_9BACT
MFRQVADRVFRILTSEADGRVCKDLPEESCRRQPENFCKHVLSLTLTKTADGLIDPKLVLSWLMTVLGAPAAYIGMLVPVREAGALLPQLFTAGYLDSLPLRKYAWAIGSFIQGACAAAMGLAVLWMEGEALGAVIIVLLALLAVARSVCSVCYKDVLGKTVDKSKRGTATGAASSLAAGLVICYALLIASGWVDRLTLVTVGLMLAALFWSLAGGLFWTLTEARGSTEGGGNPFKVALKHTSYLFTDRQLVLFILTRGLLTATALAPPFMVALGAGASGNGFAGLGWLVLASSFAGLSSSYVWGRLADHSSRKVLLLAGLLGGVALIATSLCAFYEVLGTAWLLPVLLYMLMVAYQGVRLGRSTHLVDMADVEKRAAYTALSNTVIGVLLLMGGGFGLLANTYGELTVILVFSLMCFASMAGAFFLHEVQDA